MKFFLYSTSRNLSQADVILRSIADSISALWRELMAPLRRIVSRALQVDQVKPKYSIYSLVDTLECGHSQNVYLYGGLNDLLNAYTDNPAITARRHRCRPCASLLLTKKPVQSVALGKPAVAA